MISTLAVVMVTWNNEREVENCLQSLFKQALEPLQVVVVDNASIDGTLEKVRKWADRVEVIANETNRGFAAACNQGWQAARADWILFLNPDVEAKKGALKTLIQSTRDFKEASAFAGRLEDDLGRVQCGFNVRRFPTVLDFAAELLLINKIFPTNLLNRRYRQLDWLHDDARVIEQPAAACLMVSRDALEACRGFDEQFFPAWFEDVDFCLRFARSGRTIRYSPQARFMHKGGASLQALPPSEFLCVYYRNLLYFARKHWPMPQRLLLRLVLATGMLLRLIAVSLPGVEPLRWSELARGPAGVQSSNWRDELRRGYGAVLKGAMGAWKTPSPRPS